MTTTVRADPRAAFTAGETALLRLPVLPADEVSRTRVDLAPDTDGYAERLAGYLREITKDPVVADVIAVAGPPDIVELLAGDGAGDGTASVADLRQAAFAVTRHLLRMTTGATAGGPLAGSATARFGASTSIRLGSAHRKVIRPDPGWLSAVVAEWESRPDVVRRLRLVANNLCFQRGDRLVLPVPTVVEGRPAHELSVAYTAAVRVTLAAAHTPIRYPHLVATLRERFPTAPVERLDTFVADQVRHGILLTDLRPPSNATDPIGHVRAIMADEIAPIDTELAAFAAAPPGYGDEMWRTAITSMRHRHDDGRPPAHVELRLDLTAKLATGVRTEITAAADLLWRLAPPGESPHLREYREAFVARYGHGRLVPLLELLDPTTGLGPPAGYLLPPSYRQAVVTERPPTRRDDVLAELVQRAQLNGASEIVLDERIVERLAVVDAPPADADLTVQLVAASADAIDQGDYTVWVFSAESAHLHAGIADGTRQVVRVAFPGAPWTPRLVTDVLAIGVFADRDDERTIGPDDVVVGADGDRLYLTNRCGDVEIRPLPAALDSTTPNLVRFVHELATQTDRRPAWDWGRIALLPYLPRVRFGRTVLAPALWRTPESLRDNQLPWQDWHTRLVGWRQLWRVPDLVRSTVDDVVLDLSVPLHCQLLRDTLHHRPHVMLTEAPRGGTGWSGGHAAAVTVALRGNGSPARTLPAATVAHAEVRHMPGGEWLFVKLYTQQHDDILTDRLPALLHDMDGHMDRGFFVRCVDPEPHLRIRLHRSAERLNTALWPRMHRWIEELHRSRLVSRVVVDTYEPEVNRYGGIARLALAEEIFHADSEVVLTMLRLRRRAVGRLEPAVLLAANYVDILRNTGRDDWAEWFLAGCPTRTRHPLANRLIDPAGDWAELRRVDGGEQLVTAWWHRGRALERYTETFPATDRGRAQWDRAMRSILHMHHNRAHGLDPVSEARSYAVAAGTLTADMDNPCRVSTSPVRS